MAKTRIIVSVPNRQASELPSPLAGEGPGERGRKNTLVFIRNQRDKDEVSIRLFIFQADETLRVHPLPNPSPIKGEGL